MLFGLGNHSSILSIKGLLHTSKAFVVLGIAIILTLPVSASQSLYSLITNQSTVQHGASSGQVNNASAGVHFDNISLSNLAQGVVVDVPLPTGKVATGRVITSRISAYTSADPAVQSGALAAGKRQTIISLDNNAGAVELNLTNNAVTQMMLHDTVSDSIYLADINTNGDGQLRLQDNDDHYCFKYPRNSVLQGVAQQSPQVAAQTPDISVLRNLQSRPASANVLYLDFWGGEIADSYWNATYTSNAPIEYSAFDIDADPNDFSSEERYSIWLAWREAIEDFAPFDLNITTDRAVYDAAAVTSRSQMIITPTRSWYSNNAGGVALINIFNDDREYYKAAWTWNLTDSSLGMTISHEAGHQLGLGHDGIDAQSYYVGHGVWGPIMGAPFGKPYVQWSKGEYPGANQPEDDIFKVSTKLGLIADEAGESFASATTLNLPVNDSTRLIGFGDTDTYKFNLTAPGTVDIKVVSLLAGEDESRAANLAMNVMLVKLNSSGGVESNISSIKSTDNVPLSPLTNTFEYSGNFVQGTYALQITGNSPDANWVTGFGEYGNAGEYKLSVNATSQGITTIGKPDLDRSNDTGLFIWQNARNSWVVNIVSADQPRNVEFEVTSNLGLSSIVPLSLESSDVLMQSTNSFKLSSNVAAPWVDGIKFITNAQSDTCISMTNTDVPIYIGPDRVLMPAAFDLTTLGPCNLTIIKTLGPPVIDRLNDVGIFIWQNIDGDWVANVVASEGDGDGGAKTVAINVLSDQALSNIVPISIEANDEFIESVNALDLMLNVNSPWLDGFKFSVADQSNTCLSTANLDVPIYLGPGRLNMGNNLSLNTLTICD